mgnify:CR=1 FL=1
MSQITLEPALQRQLEQVAEAVAQSPEQIVEDAVAERLRDLEGQLLELEIAAYERLHPQLKETHRGQFVAVHGGEVVDSDPDLALLYSRVRARYGSRVVLIRQVEDSSLQEFRFHGVRLDRDP